jgi:hypothetical protein
MAPYPFVGPWPLLQFRNLCYTDGMTPRTSDQPVARPRYLHTGQHKHRINAYPNTHVLSGIRTHNPSFRVKTIHALYRAATVIGAFLLISFDNMNQIHSDALGASIRSNIKINASVLPYVLWFSVWKILALPGVQVILHT